MSKFYALEAVAIKELLSYRGSVIYHDNPRELEFLFKKGVVLGSLRLVELPKKLGRPLMPLRSHPDMHAVSFPLDVRDFRMDL